MTIIDELDEFTKAYLICALETSDRLDKKSLDDFSLETLKEVIDDCRKFQQAHAKMLERAGAPSQNGHDYWLTRNFHGAGFWDRGYSYDVIKVLSEAASDAGGKYTYIADDGYIYIE